MAIVKVGTYRNPPEDITDYEAIVAHLEAYTRQIGNQGMILTEWTNTTNAPKIAIGSYISHGGVLYVVDTEDYALPALSSDGTYYLRVAASGETLALDYITDLTGYVWNAIYNGLYHSDGKQVLPYQVVKSGTLIEKYKMLNPWQNNDFAAVDYLGRYNGELHVTGAISGASINTGDGDFKIGQNLRSTDTPRFIEIYSGYVFTPGNTTLMTASSVLSTSGSVEVQTSNFVWDGRLLGSYRFGGVANTSSSSYSPIFTVKLYKNGTLILTVIQTTSKVSQEFYVDIALEEGDEIKAGIYISNSVPAGTSSATLSSLYLKVNEKPDSNLVDSQISRVSARWDATF